MYTYESRIQKDFDDHFAIQDASGKYRLSGLFYLSSFHDGDREAHVNMRNSANEFINRVLINPRYNEIKVHFDYVNSNGFNALAAKSTRAAGEYFIGINAGLSLKVFGVFASVFASTPSLFEELNEPVESKKVDVHSILNKSLIDSPAYVTVAKTGTMRSALPFICQHIAMEYVFFHEMAHIFEGHVDRICAFDDNFIALGETSDPTKIPIDDKERQIMEMHADGTALWWCAMNFTQKHSPILPANINIDWATYFRLLTFTTGVMIHCFDGVTSKLTDFNGRSHPHPELRFNSMYNSILNFIDKELVNAESIKEAVYAGVVDSVKAVNQHFDVNAFPVSFNPANTDKVVKRTSQEINNELPRYKEIWKHYKLNEEYSEHS